MYSNEFLGVVARSGSVHAVVASSVAVDAHPNGRGFIFNSLESDVEFVDCLIVVISVDTPVRNTGRITIVILMVSTVSEEHQSHGVDSHDRVVVVAVVQSLIARKFFKLLM